jgi:hypothetical protein
MCRAPEGRHEEREGVSPSAGLRTLRKDRANLEASRRTPNFKRLPLSEICPATSQKHSRRPHRCPSSMIS